MCCRKRFSQEGKYVDLKYRKDLARTGVP
ncbi:hypothetical protein F383_24229 [Gossypium arboreum]|uniref:Uncharacterized protein n=1 Tax=Gossypium arboreum TaxID=29729 RepID=A0A0B0P0L8_GOSAR|nr:hypothetical protein F383_24229 [Gossypium arboreum]